MMSPAHGISEARNLLSAIAPEFAAAELRLAAGGSSKVVWYVGDQHVLRLPLHRLARQQMEVERRLLTRLAGKFELNIPIPVATDRLAKNPRGADLCKMAPGQALDWKEWDRLTVGEKAQLSLPFARFLLRLHAEIPASEASRLGVPDYAVPEIEWLRDRLAKPLSSPRHARLLDAILAAAPALAGPGAPLALLHNDLSHHNIGFDPNRRKPVGVFDFGEACVGDLHRDLRYDPGLPTNDETVVRVYEEGSGVQVSRARQRVWHALSALENYTYSLDHEGPELNANRRLWVDTVAGWDLGFLSTL
ncbi:MAG: aminoglycoside phosphotransferase family protein [bacterium]|nr:aminoglycoside phosphotransferase family protein [bacterium]